MEAGHAAPMGLDSFPILTIHMPLLTELALSARAVDSPRENSLGSRS